MSRYKTAEIRERVGDLAALEGRPVLSLDETSALTGLSRSSVLRLIDNGQLRRIKLGNRVLIPRESIDALLAGDDR